ncbi:MAG TPA: PHB depolymerase family esterase [Pirellulales bacterium]|nr:PHB depolymerase family esterase [Pirellulales bacterium]
MSLANLYFSGWLQPGTTHSIDVGGLSRSYVVHVPKGHDAAAELPVVLALHGATMNGPMMAWFCDLNRKADEAGFIAVYPNGTGKRSSLFWNGGNCCGSAMQNKVDDVGFIDALLDDLGRAYRIDTRRVYAAGMSNGGIMVYRLAAELAHRIAAIAPVAGCRESELGQPKRPVSILHFHGTQDEFVPYTGGVGRKSITGTDFRSVEESIRAWVDWNGCEADPRIDVLSQEGDELAVTRKTYGAGKEGTEVVLVTIDGGGHTWPGRKGPARFLGRSALNISANDLMWEFFQKHPLP